MLDRLLGWLGLERRAVDYADPALGYLFGDPHTATGERVGVERAGSGFEQAVGLAQPGAVERVARFICPGGMGAPGVSRGLAQLVMAVVGRLQTWPPSRSRRKRSASPMTAGQEQPRTVLPPHRPLAEFYPGPAARVQFVGDLFDHAARDYDWISRVMSLGTDRFYRRFALRRAGLRPGMKVLDVATGTGLLAQAALEVGIPASDLTGLDPSKGMLEQNCRRHPIRLLQGIGEALPFYDATFDFVLMGYALRHVEDLVQLFAEFRRVLRRPGRVLILEITRPSSLALIVPGGMRRSAATAAVAVRAAINLRRLMRVPTRIAPVRYVARAGPMDSGVEPDHYRV